MNLKGKKVLFSIQEHFLLKDDIKNNVLNVLKSEAEECIFISDKFRNRCQQRFYKLFNSVNKRIKTERFQNFYTNCKEKAQINEIKKYRGEGADYILFISGCFYSKNILKFLKEANPNAKMILFLYDKLKYSSFEGKVDCFDFVFSYDRQDALENNFIFRPTFYVDKCLENIPSEKKYNFYYIGVLRDKKRYQYVKWLKDYLELNNLKVFFKLFVRKEDKKYLPKNYDKDLIITEVIPYNKNIEILKNSKVVLDLKYKDQKGLTLRCYEAIAAGTKIITDNEDIVNYDFYNENNIKIIKNIEDVKNIPLEFFRTSVEKIDKKIKERYSIKGFLNEIFETVEREKIK